MPLGIGPFGSGMLLIRSPIARRRSLVAVTWGPVSTRGSLSMVVRTFFRGTCPSPVPTMMSCTGTSTTMRFIFFFSAASRPLTRFGLPSATRTMPALPTARCTTSWLRFIATAGVVVQPRPMLSSTAAAAPGCPSICPNAARSARRPKMIAVPRKASRKPRMPR